jgi:hypothetical protein
MAQSLLHVVCPHCGAVNRLSASRLGEAPKCGSCHQPLFNGAPVAVDAAGFERTSRATTSRSWSISGRPGTGHATPWRPRWSAPPAYSSLPKITIEEYLAGN